MNLDFLKKIVEIDSRTENIDGVNQIQKILGDNLASLGFDVKYLCNNQDKTGKLLFAQRKGLSKKAISFVCHADTVIGPTNDFKFQFDLINSRAYGAGIGDNKAGIAMALGAIKDFIESQNDHYYTLNFICSPSEETGSIGFHDFFKYMGEESDYLFGLEPALSNGNIINQRSGNRWFKIEIKGISGHAGRWNEKTINAAHLGMELVSNLVSFNDSALKRRVNVAKIVGGSDRYNVVCGDLELRLDTRFKDFQSRDLISGEIVQKINELMLQDSEIKIEYSIVDDCPPLSQNLNSKIIEEKILKFINCFEGKKIKAEYSGGAADVNYFQNEKLISLDGLGPIAVGMHTKKEFICLESFYTRRHVLSAILMEINRFNEGEYYANNSL